MLVCFRPLVRLLVAVLCASLATALVAASPPPVFGAAPVVVIFPFKTADGLDPVNGQEYAVAIGNAITKAGGIKVIVGDPATTQSNFLHVTAASGGDYYLTGFVSMPVRGTSSVLEQIVSRRSGTAVWGYTANVANDSDIRDQGPIVQNALLTYVMRGYSNVIKSTPAPAPTKYVAEKKKNGISAGGGAPIPGETPHKTLDLPNEAYGYSSAPTPQPKQYASAAHPTRFAIMNITGASAPDAIKHYTEDSLVNTLSHHGQPAAQGDPDQTKHFLMHPQDTCKQTGSAFLVFGTIATKSTDVTLGIDSWTDARFTPMIYDCAAQEYNRTAKPIAASAVNWKTAVDLATLKAVTDFFSKLGKTSAHA